MLMQPCIPYKFTDSSSQYLCICQSVFSYPFSGDYDECIWYSSRTRSSGNIHYLLIHEWFINFIIPHIASLYILKSIVSCSILNINSASLFVSYKRVDPESVMILVNKVAGEWDSFEVTQYIFPLDPHIITPINQFFFIAV